MKGEKKTVELKVTDGVEVLSEYRAVGQSDRQQSDNLTDSSQTPWQISRLRVGVRWDKLGQGR